MRLNNLFYRFCRFVLLVIFKLLYFFRVYGRENVPRQGGCIIASNHLSLLDPMVLSIASPRILTFMAKKQLFEVNPVFTWLITALNAFPLEREKGDVRALRGAINKLKQGRSMIIFPEGTRSRGGAIGSAQSGLGMLAAYSRVPVVPAFILGTEKALPAESKKIRCFQKIAVYFGKPMVFRSGENTGREQERDLYLAFSREVISQIKEIKKNACK